MSDTDVLIVGAGPTGLALALSLERQGVKFRIIDKAPAPGLASRAIAVQARILEQYDQFGIADEVVAAGLKIDKPTLWTKHRRTVIPFGDFGRGLSPYPFLLMYPQDDHEKLLISHLKTPIERSKALQSFQDDKSGVTAMLTDGEIIRCQYICGCDGAHSMVREQMGTGFPGGTYDQVFYVADVDADHLGHVDEFYFFLRKKRFLLVLPLPGQKRFRLIGIVPPQIQKDIKSITFDDIAPSELEETPLRVTQCHWFSAYHVHHRVTAQFQKGRAFLLGDAAHIHSPAGGQGMNTGIGDALNLGWKLGAVLQNRIDASALDTYASERRAFALRLVASTDRIFMAVVGERFPSNIIRVWIFPYVIPLLMRVPFFRRFAFKTLSQIVIQYRMSALSEGQVGVLRAGDRLPWTGNNFAPLKNYDWRLHIYGDAQAPADIPAYVFVWDDAARKRGFARDAYYLVRPDGYIGFAGTDLAALKLYISRNKISFRAKT